MPTFSMYWNHPRICSTYSTTRSVGGELPELGLAQACPERYAGVEPDVEYVLYPVLVLAALRAREARPCRCGACDSPSWRKRSPCPSPAPSAPLKEPITDISPAVPAYPDGHWDSPVPLPGYAPVWRVLEYVVLPLPHLLRMPLILSFALISLFFILFMLRNHCFVARNMSLLEHLQQCG